MTARRQTLLPLGSAIFFAALTLDVLFALNHLSAYLRLAMHAVVLGGLIVLGIGLAQLIIFKFRRPGS
jgi:hypothetical protein